MQKRIYLECSFDEKDHCKSLGARWDKDKKKWFITDEMDPLLFQKWWPDRESSSDKEYFVNEERIEELETTIEDLASQVSVLQSDDFDAFFYKSPPPAIAEFRDEVEEWKNFKEDHPGWWALFRTGVDAETLAFYSLSDDSRLRLIN
jgi:hypothetical protein